ncbi:MAG TPA: helix-turn-helix domain-containing protein, partial [Mycobacterium sp.]|nr:helix-turn-helix domain-containing protein [Mycobacterium sp.]
MGDDVKTKGRKTRVADPEERIVAAARTLFVRDGYVATTLVAVADQAGVAHRTVYARFGTKAALLKRVVDVAIVGDVQPVDLHSRDDYRAILEADTLDERIRRSAAMASALMERVADFIAVAS